MQAQTTQYATVYDSKLAFESKQMTGNMLQSTLTLNYWP